MEKIISKIIEKLLEQMSDELRQSLVQMVRNLEVVAKKTENPWDDILVLIIKVAMGID